MAEEFDLHLLELAASEDEVARCNFVAKRLSDLGDSKRNLHAAAVEDVAEVDEDSLGGFGAEVGLVRLVANSTSNRLEHEIERSRIRQVTSTGGAGSDISSG